MSTSKEHGMSRLAVIVQSMKQEPAATWCKSCKVQQGISSHHSQLCGS